MPKTCSDFQRLVLHGPTMGTRWSVTCDAAPETDANTDALRQALAKAVQQIDAQMSPWLADSDLNRFNRTAPGEWLALPAETMEVLACALDICRLSDGAFDPGAGELVDAWGFGPVRNTPDAAAIRAAKSSMRPPTHDVLELDPSTGRARKHANMQLDLCGIAKGYAVDRMASVLKQSGVQHALVALDGELRALGNQAGGDPWAVAVESPEVGRRAVHGVLELQDMAVATSGDYRRFIEIDHLRLSHTMDTHRAAPVLNDVTSVTVLARTCMHADAWATALLVAGAEQGQLLAQRMGLEVLWMLRRENHLITLGLDTLGLEAASMPNARQIPIRRQG